MSVTIDGTQGVSKVAPYGVEASDLDYNLGSLSFRNKLINSGFDFWQRATNQTNSGYGSDDRWYNGHLGVSKTHSLQTFTLGQTSVSGNPKSFSRTEVSNVEGADYYCIKEQKVESVSTLAGKTATLSFWAKADATRNIAVEFQQFFGTGGSPSTGISFGITTLTLTNVWQKFTLTVQVPSITGKVLGSNSDDYLSLIFWFNSGSTYNARNNTLGQQSGIFDIAQVQLEEGSVATPFEERFSGLEQILCQRFFQNIAFSFRGYQLAGGHVRATTDFSVRMRKPPVMTHSILENTNLSGLPAAITSWVDYVSTVVPHTATGEAYYTSTIALDAEL